MITLWNIVKFKLKSPSRTSRRQQLPLKRSRLWLLRVHSGEETFGLRSFTPSQSPFDVVTLRPGAGTVAGGPAGAAAATGSSPCAGHGWRRRPQGGSFCRSNGLSISGSLRSWSRRHSPASQKKKKKTRYQMLRLLLTLHNSNDHPGKGNPTKLSRQKQMIAENQHLTFLDQMNFCINSIEVTLLVMDDVW